MTLRIWDSFRLVLAIGTLAIGAYLTAAHYNTQVTLACSSSGIVSCDQVLSSPQSKFLGIPWAVLGMAWSFVAVVLAGLSLARSGREPALLRGAGLAWALAGVATVVYLLYLELGVIKKICLGCTATHVIVLLMFVIQMITAPWRTTTDAGEDVAAPEGQS